MTRQYIDIQGRWSVVVYHCATRDDTIEINDALTRFGCSLKSISKVLGLIREKDKGATITDDDKRMSVVVISEPSSKAEYVNTVAHESKHVVSAICDYYNIEESSEESAYLLGGLVMRMDIAC